MDFVSRRVVDTTMTMLGDMTVCQPGFFLFIFLLIKNRDLIIKKFSWSDYLKYVPASEVLQPFKRHKIFTKKFKPKDHS